MQFRSFLLKFWLDITEQNEHQVTKSAKISRSHMT